MGSDSKHGVTANDRSTSEAFAVVWNRLITTIVKEGGIWRDQFSEALSSEKTVPTFRFQLAAVWATCMVPGSYAFPSYVTALAARAAKDVVRHSLIENAWDESGGVHHQSRSHYWLAVRLAYLLGLSDGEIDRIVPLGSAKAYMDAHYQQCSQGNFEFALGMICLIEEFTTPEFTMIFKAMLATSQDGLGMAPAEFVLRGGAEYFTANISDDERHREDMPRVVAAQLASRGVNLDDSAAAEKEVSQVISGMQESIRLRAQFFQDIFDFVKAGGTYRDLVGL